MPRERFWSSKPIDITGRMFGDWTVLRRSKGSIWECQCKCGVVRLLQGNSLKAGLSKRCRACSSALNAKHGMEGTRTYNIWSQMKRRCLNPKAAMYVNYGARGIRICDRWLSFAGFLSDMGPCPSPSHSIDRIDNDGNYEPSNCRWATAKQQIRNRRNTVTVLWNGRSRAIGDLADEHGISVRLVRERISVGWSVQKALTTPSRTRRD